MSTVDYIKTVFGNKKVNLLKQYRIKEIAVIGSVTEEELNEKEDINMVVEFSSSPDIFEMCALEYHLTALLGRKVDLFTKNSLKPKTDTSFMKEIVYI